MPHAHVFHIFLELFYFEEGGHQVQNKLSKISVVLAFMALAQSGWPLPVDWNGIFSMDTTRLDTYTRTAKGVVIPEDIKDGDQRIIPVSDGIHNASFQTYLLKLRPTIIVNDAVSLFGEITTGYASGGHLGQGIEQTGDHKGEAKNHGLGNALYNYNTYRDKLHIRQIYAKYYSDTATYVIGRQPLHWGLGAILNDGSRNGERLASVEDGIMAHLNIGNFQFSPYYMKVNGQDLDSGGDLKSTGVQAMYRNSEQEMSLGLLWGKRTNRANATFLRSNIIPNDSDSTSGTTAHSYLGSAEVKIIDLYFQKRLKKFNFELEVPLMDGKLGQVYSTEKTNGYNAKAFIGKASYELNPSWKLGLDIGHISGDQGEQNSKFEALYLHPNYQIAHLMFRYNLHAINSANEKNIFDSYMTNMTYTKLMASYRIDKWLWNLALIWASAIETAQAETPAFHHEKNETYRAEEDQGDSYGFEIDLDFKYEWNSNVSILGSLGYHFVGDYYQHDNDPNAPDPELKKSYAAQLQTVIQF